MIVSYYERDPKPGVYVETVSGERYNQIQRVHPPAFFDPDAKCPDPTEAIVERTLYLHRVRCVCMKEWLVWTDSEWTPTDEEVGDDRLPWNVPPHGGVCLCEANAKLRAGREHYRKALWWD